VFIHAQIADAPRNRARECRNSGKCVLWHVVCENIHWVQAEKARCECAEYFVRHTWFRDDFADKIVRAGAAAAWFFSVRMLILSAEAKQGKRKRPWQ